MKQSVRIIGGLYRGKQLSFPAIDGLRPTPSRVRETVFNWLMHDIQKAHCLDAFAGSGALGFEAFSRSADEVVLIEQSLPVYLNLKKISQSFDSTKLTVIQANAFKYIQEQAKLNQKSFDIIFMDPPFTETFPMEMIQILSDTNILIPGGLLYLESPQEISLDKTRWRPLKSKRTGQVVYQLYRKDQAPDPKIP